MTTIAEDLATLISTDFNDATITETVHVFMKTDQDTTALEPPTVPLANKATIVIYEGVGVPIRYTEGSDIIVYTGVLIVYTNSYASMILTTAELKQISDDLTTGVGELFFTVPPIKGDKEEGMYECMIRYTWEKLIARG